MKTFKCNFGHGIAATIQTTDDFPLTGSHIQRIDWVGNPRKVDPNRYISWMNSVNSVLSSEWGRRIMHVFQDGKDPQDLTKAQVWVCDPGQPPKLIPTPDFTKEVQAGCVGFLQHEKAPLILPQEKQLT